ncbi:MAG: hypothetical protein ACK4UJ_01280 [Leptonema sp. (in: bacteria)]
MQLHLLSFLLAIFFLIGILFLYFYLKQEFSNSLISIDVKEKGFLYFLRIHLDSIFRPIYSKNLKLIILSWFFFVLLHLFFPFLLASFILKHDWNVLIAIFSLIFSINIFQKIYPANLYSKNKKDS